MRADMRLVGLIADRNYQGRRGSREGFARDTVGALRSAPPFVHRRQRGGAAQIGGARAVSVSEPPVPPGSCRRRACLDWLASPVTWHVVGLVALQDRAQWCHFQRGDTAAVQDQLTICVSALQQTSV
jgi:hypothetical protein